MTIKETLVEQLYDDSGEVWYILPSGFVNRHIFVSESPVGLEVRLITTEERAALLEQFA